MTVADLISRPDLTLIPDGDNLRVRGKLTEDDREFIRQHKAELLAVLTSRQKHCPAYPKTGLLAGASWQWCMEAKGAMAACGSCPWNRVH